MKESIFDRVDKDLWQEIQNKFADEIKLPVVTIDLEGNTIASSNKFPFLCELFKSKKVSLCKKEWLLHLYKSKSKEGIYMFPCKGGLFNVMAPLKLHDSIFGAVIICGIKKEQAMKDYGQVAVQIGVEKNELIDAFDDINKIEDEEIRKKAELLSMFANTFPAIAKKSYDSNKKNLNLSMLLELLSIAHTKKKIEESSKSIMNYLVNITEAVDCSILINTEEGIKKFSYNDHVQIGFEHEKKLMLQNQLGCSLININKEFGLNIDSKYNHLLIMPLKSKEKQIGAVLLYGENIQNLKGEDLGFYSVLSQEVSLIILNAIQYEEIENLAIKDKLTGVYNRRFFMDSINKEIEKGEPISLMLIDIDNFGNYNNTYGHQEGDTLLKEIGKILKENTRIIDTVGRYGGEEFIILLPNTKSNQAIPVAERIRTVIENQKFNETVTVSIGLVSCIDKRIRAEELIRESDKALYEAKSKGKNRIIKRVIIDKNMSRYDL